ncbi:hypothetical protein D3C85_1205240 [compost metagenome]
MKRFTLLTALFLLPFGAHSGDFEKATERHAQTAARDLLVQMSQHREKGISWKTILTTKLPEQIDDSCGYQELINLPEDGFEGMKAEVAKVAGNRFDKEFNTELSRPGASVDLVRVSSIKLSSGDHALVVLRVIPAQATDKNISLLYQLNSEGRMSLCDVIPGQKVDEGIIRKLGKELNL